MPGLLKMENNLRHRYLRKFSDGNICEVVFEVIDNKVSTNAVWKEPANYELLNDELGDWNFDCGIDYAGILEGVYGEFYLGKDQEIIKVKTEK